MTENYYVNTSQRNMTQSWMGPIHHIQNLEISNLKDSRTKMKERSLQKRSQSSDKDSETLSLSNINILMNQWSSQKYNPITPKKKQLLNYPQIDEKEETEQRFPINLPSQQSRYDGRKQKISSKSTIRQSIQRSLVYEKTLKDYTDAQQRLHSVSVEKRQNPQLTSKIVAVGKVIMTMTQYLKQENLVDTQKSNYSTIDKQKNQASGFELDLSKTFPRQGSEQAATSLRTSNQVSTSTGQSYVSPSRDNFDKKSQHRLSILGNFFESKTISSNLQKRQSNAKQGQQGHLAAAHNIEKQKKKPYFSYQKSSQLVKEKMSTKIEKNMDFRKKVDNVDEIKLQEIKAFNQLMKIKDETKAFYRIFQKSGPQSTQNNKHFDSQLDQQKLGFIQRLYGQLVDKVKQDIKSHLQ